MAQPLPLQPSVTFGAAGNGCEVVVTRSSVAQAEPRSPPRRLHVGRSLRDLGTIHRCG